MQHNRFTLNGRANPCPICASDDGRCKESSEQIQLCMGALTRDDVPGFEFRRVTKNGVWGLWVQAQNFSSPEERKAWQTQLERKKLQRHLAQQKERETALTADERHEGYTALLTQLTLDECDRNDLLNRGFTDEQIKTIGFKSVTQWHSLGDAINPKLPGASPDGTRLNIPYAGYLCPAYDADGRICGAQVRGNSDDGPRYYWLTSRTRKNITGSTPHMPSGELPLSVYWPENVTTNRIAFVEGIGPKPALAATRLGCPVIGAAGAQWGSSHSELQSALGAILGRLDGAVDFVLYPDGGMMDARHEPVRDRYRHLSQCLGAELQVAWWGQTAYGQDIDEVAQGVSIAYLSMAEFEAMAEADGELPEELLLELQVKDYAGESNPFKRTLKANVIGSEFKVRGKNLDRLAEYSLKANGEYGASMDELVAGIFGEIEDRSQGNCPQGVPSGFHDLDAMTQGFQPSELIIVAGRPGQGKTSFALNSAICQAKAGKRVSIFSLEMSKHQLAYRMLSMLARIESGRLRTGRIAHGEWDPMGHKIADLSQLPIWIDDHPAITVDGIRDKLLSAEYKPDIVYIDYLQLIDGPEESANARVSNISRGLQKVSRELDIPIIALSQLSRSVESRNNKRPIMSDLRDSGAIEQDASLILMLYRDEYYDENSPDRGIAEVIIAKARNGPTGTVKLLFEPQFTLFRNLSPGVVGG